MHLGLNVISAFSYSSGLIQHLIYLSTAFCLLGLKFRDSIRRVLLFYQEILRGVIQKEQRFRHQYIDHVRNTNINVEDIKLFENDHRQYACI